MVNAFIVTTALFPNYPCGADAKEGGFKIPLYHDTDCTTVCWNGMKSKLSTYLSSALSLSPPMAFDVVDVDPFSAFTTGDWQSLDKLVSAS